MLLLALMDIIMVKLMKDGHLFTMAHLVDYPPLQIGQLKVIKPLQILA